MTNFQEINSLCQNRLFDYISDYETILSSLDDKKELTSITPSITSSGRLIYQSKTKNVVFKGVDFDRAEGIYKFKEKLDMSNSQIPKSLNEIAIGVGLKDILNVNIGDTISFIDNSNPTETNDFIIVAFIDFNVLDLNNSWIISTLEASQRALDLDNNQAQAIEMQLRDPFKADEVNIDIIDELNNSNIQSITWIERNQDLLSGLQGQSISSLMIQIFVIISVVLGISSVLAITVLQKSKQLGILKAMGIKDKDASKIFLFEGFILGVLGAIVGIALGIGLLYAFDFFADTGIPITIDLAFLSLSAGIAIVASTLAALAPAIKSSKLSVIEVIRNG